MYDDDEIDLRTLKYVLYLRKSTEDEGRQIRSIKDERALQTITEQIAEASQFIQEQERLIERNEKSLERSTLPAIDKAVFKATLKEMAEKLKAADVVQKDIIVSNMFLKLHFDQQKMTYYSLKEPFASLVEFTSFQHGGGGRN